MSAESSEPTPCPHPVIVDASATAPWVLPDEADDRAWHLYAEAREGRWRLLAPALWRSEMGNVMVLGERRGRLDAQARANALLVLRRAPVEVLAAPDMEQFELITALAAEQRLTFYDATYLVTAQRHRAALASRDTDLIAAARRLGIECL